MFIYPNFKHQDFEFDNYKNTKARALIWHMRTGKSKAMIDLASYLYNQGEINGVIIVAPNNVHLNWERREIPKHIWSNIITNTFSWVASNYNENDFNNFINTKNKFNFYIMNNESLLHDVNLKNISKFVKVNKKKFLLIVDEVHEFRGNNSERLKKLKGLAKHATYIRILSANPCDNSPIHAFSEFSILEKGALGFETLGAMKQYYCEFKDLTIKNKKTGAIQTIKTIDKYKNLEDLKERILKWSTIVKREDINDMPDLVFEKIYFEISDEQMKIYNNIQGNSIVRTKNNQLIKPVDGGALLIRLQQILSGYIKTETNEDYEFEENTRLKALLNLLPTLKGKTIIWTKFRKDVEYIIKALGDKAVDYYGGTTMKNRKINEDKFKTKDSCLFLVGQYEAGGQGLDFSNASNIIWYSQTSNLLKHKQADERATKIGGRNITIIDLIANNTIDEEKILENLKEKIKTSKMVTG